MARAEELSGLVEPGGHLQGVVVGGVQIGFRGSTQVGLEWQAAINGRISTTTSNSARRFDTSGNSRKAVE